MIDKGIVFLSIYDMESYALRILSQILKREDYICRQVYFKKLYASFFPYTRKEVDILIDLLARFDTKLLCVSLRSSSLKTFSSLSGLIREKLPDINILIGGTHSTLAPSDALNYADAVCIGDGEKTIVDVAKNYNGEVKSLAGIKGVRTKLGQDNIVDGGARGAFEDLDSLPIEIYGDENKYYIEDNCLCEKEPLIENSSIEVFASRGCPRQCAFCSNSALSKIIGLKGQKFVRIKGVESTIKDLLYLKNRFKNIKRFIFADEVFGLNKEWVREFCKVYPKEIGLPFSALFYVSLINESAILKLKEAGLSHARVGIQSGSERIRKDLYKRIENNTQIIATGNLFNKLNIRFTYDLIVNNPYETEFDKHETLELLANLPRPFELNLHSLVYFPSTVLTNRALSDRLIRPEDVEGKHSCKGLFLTDVLSLWEGNDIFWNSLFSLSSKGFISRKLLLRVAKSRFFKKRKPLILYLAKLGTIIKMIQIGVGIFIKKEITLRDTWKMAKSMIGNPLTNK